MKTTSNRTTLVYNTAFVLFFSLLLVACKKNIDLTLTDTGTTESHASASRTRKPFISTNPLTIRNIKAIKQRKATQSAGNARLMDESIPEDQQMLYVRIDSNVLTTDALIDIENSDDITVLDFPFANGNIYEDEITGEAIEAFKDGYLYAVFPREHNVFDKYGISVEYLDTLYKPKSDDDPVLQEALIGSDPITEADARICFRRPSGTVRYTDTDLGADQPVINTEVSSFLYGIRISTHTDEIGRFTIPWRYLAGTLITTRAKNNRVTVKPVIMDQWRTYFMLQQFIIGSVHVRGVIKSCNLPDIEINYTDHRQSRLWAHILNAVHFHDQFTSDDHILNAPDHLTIWAFWGVLGIEESDWNIHGGQSTPMFGHIPNCPSSLVLQYLSSVFGADDITSYPNLLNTVASLYPDVTLFSNVHAADFVSSSFMQTAFHELAHASHYRVAGNDYWVDVMKAEIFFNRDCRPYGCGDEADAGNVQVTEAWAEFLGTEYALRRYPFGQKTSQQLAGGGLVLLQTAIEDERWFANDWIPDGIFHDLSDPFNPFEPLDNIQGATIQEMYNVLDPSTDNICLFYDRFTQLYGGRFNPVDVRFVFNHNNIFDCRF